MTLILKLIVAGMVLMAMLAVGYWWGKTQSQSDTAHTDSPPDNKERKVLYYRNPMGLADTSPVPKKDPMGMDYLPVYAGEETPPEQNAITISTEKVQKLGVRTEAAALRELIRTVRAVATVQPDERTQYEVVTKFEGWIHRLYVNATGQTVRKGDVLMDIYSPELITAQQEYLIATRGLQAVADADKQTREAMQRLVASALQKLRNWDIAETEIRRLQRSGEVQQYLALRAK
ncbi:MAG: efflux RND transporter periplasmic adaptor subunit, partial [Betaproteobacteria bacterium]|nr:efflux RND transporter periplasmic adaptor subunit [Betaproteobacteria bacterium]